MPPGISSPLMVALIEVVPLKGLPVILSWILVFIGLLWLERILEAGLVDGFISLFLYMF